MSVKHYRFSQPSHSSYRIPATRQTGQWMCLLSRIEQAPQAQVAQADSGKIHKPSSLTEM